MRYLVLGASGFLGGHLCHRLLAEGHEVHGVGRRSLSEWWQKPPRAGQWIRDLSKFEDCLQVLSATKPDVVVNLAADMGGIGYIKSNHYNCLSNASISINVINAIHKLSAGGQQRPLYVFASSSCVYPSSPDIAPAERCNEVDAWPADPEGGYGLEKLFSEQLAQSSGLSVRIARIFNTYGPLGDWRGGKEKSVAAICRKIAIAKKDRLPSIEIWGTGTAVRTYTYVDDTIEGLLLLIGQSYPGPVNIGSDEPISVFDLADKIRTIAGYDGAIVSTPGERGVQRRVCDSRLAEKLLGFRPKITLEDGLSRQYKWIEQQVNNIFF